MTDIRNTRTPNETAKKKGKYRNADINEAANSSHVRSNRLAPLDLEALNIGCKL